MTRGNLEAHRGALMTRLALPLLLASIASPSERLVFPTQTELTQALRDAEHAWGTHVDVAGISLAPLDNCQTLERVGWANLATGTIQINSSCRYEVKYLQLIVDHEYGHLLLRTSAHSLDPHSLMFWQVRPGQTITPADQEWVQDAQNRERPTIMRGEL